MSSKTKATATKEEAIPALVPKLRFPEFREGEGWEYAPLGKLLMKSPDYGVNAAAVPFTERLPQYLRITDISEDGTYLSAKKVSVDLEPTEEIYLDEGDIVLARTGASVGKSYRYRKEDGRLVFAGFLIRVKPNPKRLVSAYLANFLTTKQYWKWVAATSARSGQPGINSVEYSALAIPLPTEFREQQKIAECLSSADELIATQARKVDALKTHKKGLMQQLFPREGETQPRLRFPEFKNAAEWVSNSLGVIFEMTSGGTPSRTEKAYWNGNIPWITTSLVDFRVITSAEEFISAEGMANSSAKLFPKGTVLMAMYGQGKTRGQVALLGIEAATNQACAAILPREGIDPYFLFTNLAGRYDEIRGMSNSGGQENLSQGLLREIQFAFPPEDVEQRKITSCLSSLDALIAAETQKLEALKSHKSGLMQQLFPSPQSSQT
ncbi:restriction modification system DNA specificity domain protein [Burkholderia sp. YI23]|nr:restriction modification system DNA specificity domain protein [Burkholderia sp. YI23]